MSSNPFSFTKIWKDSVAIIIGQLTQGVTPQKIALSIALGFSLGVIPILGTTTILCAIAAFRLKLNQPVIQLVNWLVYPLELALLLVFVRLGEWITHAPPTNFSIPGLIQTFHESPVKFFQEFGMLGLHGTIAWLLIAPFATAIIYSVLVPPLKRLATLTTQIANAGNAKRV